ncbi:hypothetical protein ACWD3I_24970 [Streptomyces sp. NPDC002817]
MAATAESRRTPANSRTVITSHNAGHDDTPCGNTLLNGAVPCFVQR